jgi:hypothetical protein
MNTGIVLKNHPEHLLRYLAGRPEVTTGFGAAYEKELRSQYRCFFEAKLVSGSEVKAQAEIEHHAAALLLWPQLAGEIGLALLINPATERIVSESLNVRLHLVTAASEQLDAEVEEPLLASPEHVVALLRSAKSGRTKLRFKRERYDDALFDGLYWARQWALESGDTWLFKAAMDEARGRRMGDGQAALLALSEDPPHKDCAEALILDPMAAYLGRRLLVGEGYSIPIERVNGITPRWAYHFLIGGVGDRGIEEQLEAIVIKDELWLGEYIADSAWHTSDWDRLAALVLKAKSTEQTVIGSLLIQMCNRIRDVYFAGAAAGGGMSIA